MGYETATAESVLLKYLELRGTVQGKRPTTSDLIHELGHAEKKLPTIEIYGFRDQEDEAGNRLLNDVLDLEGFGFVDRDDVTMELFLTDWGKLCANLFSLPAPLRQTFEHVINESHTTAQKQADRNFRAACVAL